MTTVTCPNCGGDRFKACASAPTESTILSWDLEDGKPSPDEYTATETFYELETPDDKPYKCVGCEKQFTADELIVEK